MWACLCQVRHRNELLRLLRYRQSSSSSSGSLPPLPAWHPSLPREAVSLRGETNSLNNNNNNNNNNKLVIEGLSLLQSIPPNNNDSNTGTVGHPLGRALIN